MSDTVKLTMEVEVPRDQLPEGYTGRLLWRPLKPGEHALSELPDPGFMTWRCDCGTQNRYPVIEVHQPWRVPDYLRDKRFNGWTLRKAGRILLVSDDCGGIMTVSSTAPIQTRSLGWEWSDFEGMKADKSYKIGEDAE